MADPDPPITLPQPTDRPAAIDTSSLLGSAELNPDAAPPSGVGVTPSAPPASVVAPAVAPQPRVPMEWQSPKRSGLGGIIDEFRDAIAGSPGHKIYTDESGNQYVGARQDTNRAKWLRVAANLASGAAAGYAAGQGPGGQGRAAVAGFQNALQQQDRQRQQQKELTAEARQENQERFNTVKQQLDLATTTLNLQRLKATTSRDEVDFYEKQVAWHKEQGDVDLGIIPDWQHPDAVRKNDPDFFKHLYQDGTISGVPVVDENGRGGIHVFLKTQNPKNTIIPAGHEIARYNPPKKPGDKPTLTYEKTTGPMAADAFETQNTDAIQKYHDFTKQDQKDEMDKVELQAKRQGIITAQEEVRLKRAQEAEAYAKAGQARAETAVVGGGAESPMNQDIYAGLAEGRYIMGKDIPTRTTKEQTSAAQYNYGANQWSMQHYGLPYSPTIIRQEDDFAKDRRVQAFLDGIDKMVGTPDHPGQLDYVLDLAKKAGIRESAPIAEVELGIRNFFGEETAKNFHQALSDTQSGLGTLIGNPLLGGGESDLKLKTAQAQFGKNITLKNLSGAVDTAKGILTNSRDEMARHNRFIQKRYGTPTPLTPPPGAGAGAGPAPVPDKVKTALQNLPPGHKYTLSDKSSWNKNADGSITPAQP